MVVRLEQWHKRRIFLRAVFALFCKPKKIILFYEHWHHGLDNIIMLFLHCFPNAKLLSRYASLSRTYFDIWVSTKTMLYNTITGLAESSVTLYIVHIVMYGTYMMFNVAINSFWCFLWTFNSRFIMIVGNVFSRRISLFTLPFYGCVNLIYVLPPLGAKRGFLYVEML